MSGASSLSTSLDFFGDDARFDDAAAEITLVVRVAGKAIAELTVSLSLAFVDLRPLKGSEESVNAARSAVKEAVAEASATKEDEGSSLEMRLFVLAQGVQDALAEAVDRAEAASASAVKTAPGGKDSTVDHCVLLLIDHMRSKRSYCEQIENWARSLSLGGRLSFLGEEGKATILLFLRGRQSDLRAYLQLHRTTPVDVDAMGRKCKEKMMTSLFEGEAIGSLTAGGTGAGGKDSFVIEDPASSASPVVSYLLSQGVPKDCLEGIPALRTALASL
jgi:hypothetical protein